MGRKQVLVRKPPAVEGLGVVQPGKFAAIRRHADGESVDGERIVFRREYPFGLSGKGLETEAKLEAINEGRQR